MSLSIFLSHAWDDKRGATFKRIETALRDAGYDVWVDKRRIGPGDHIETEIVQGIDGSDLVIGLWSSAYVASGPCRFEVDQALARGKPFVVARLDEADPEADARFKGKLYIDFRSSPAEALARLQQFLLALRQRSSALLRENEDVGARMAAIDDLLADLDDVRVRREKGATGNEASDAYVAAMLSAGERLIATSTHMADDEKARVRTFMQRVREISATYPDPADDERRKALLRTAIDEADPDARSMLLQGFAQAMDAAGVPAATPPTPRAVEPPDPLRAHVARVRAQPGASNTLRRHLASVQDRFGGADPEQCERVLNGAIDAIPSILEQLSAAARQAGIEHLVAPLVRQVAEYFLTPHDLVPDHTGPLGLLDDAYLAHAFLMQVNQVYQASTGRPLLPVAAEPTVQVLGAVLGPSVTMQLDAWVAHGVGQAVAQARYEELVEWNGSLGGGGRAGGPGSWGGAWEDEMARMAAGMGFSFG